MAALQGSAPPALGTSSTSTTAADLPPDTDVQVDGPSSSHQPSASTPADGPTKSSATSPEPEDGDAALPIRDKDSFTRVMVDRFQTRDWVHSSLLGEDQIRLEKTTKDVLARTSDFKTYKEFYHQYPARLYGEGYRGYGNGYTENGGTTKLIYPSQRRRPGRRATPPVKFTKSQIKKQAEQPEELVPVRIDVDYDKIKLRDTFTFNLYERLVSVEHFAAELVEDMGLEPPLAKPVYDQVVAQMTEQLQDFFPFVHSEEEALDPELPYSAYKNDEMRILIKLNITIGAHTLVDQFEWELNNPLNSPEEFAACMARDLSLSGEFTTAIAHCIREQVQLFTRSLYSVGHPFDGRPIEDPDLLAAFLPTPLPSVFRPQQQAKDYAPYLYENTEAELERTENMFSREQRRQKRSTNRRGGPQLPDLKERQRTIRTSIVSSVLPGAALNIEESRLFKRAIGAGAGRGGKRTLRDGVDLSDSEDSDESDPDSPAVSQLQGTARTRGMRGAATAAAQRMANIGRSETPEAVIHHHETRTSRRYGREATREQTEDVPQQYMITLRVNPARLRKFMREYKPRPLAALGSATPTPVHLRAPGVAGSMGPPSTPSAAGGAVAPNVQNQQDGIPAPPPNPDGTQPKIAAPPPPAWLTACLDELRRDYPNDIFDSTMRYFAINSETGNSMPLPLTPEQMALPTTKYVFLPRIKCADCPGKSYTVGPEHTVKGFEVHLRKNNTHQERVRARLAGGGGLLVVGDGRSPSVGAGSGAPAGGTGIVIPALNPNHTRTS
ncbi:SWI/SNF chromatin-remodeling complex subunit [Podospora pseudoanserina]|uniref:SWI/SNF chromatin-remodeling complex subunit n=1 Tax=Podospora pseudoanserina TaxID=2609844 RepID=A0ABR0HKY8_9PEZI|nr:SWI/SNF chromatin-remodeling complex subunit [Podospora pseudoanserina]